jgi:hypothetical protein
MKLIGPFLPEKEERYKARRKEGRKEGRNIHGKKILQKTKKNRERRGERKTSKNYRKK